MELFEDIFIDIGDERSFDNDLSTYSLHRLDMKTFCGMSDRIRYFHRGVRSGDRTDIGGAAYFDTWQWFNLSNTFFLPVLRSVTYC